MNRNLKSWKRIALALGSVCIVLCGTGCFGNLSGAVDSSLQGTTTTIIIVRHAERDPGVDPPLIEEGVMRAESLKEALLEDGVTAIYTTDLLRNRQTVQPLADALDLPINLVSSLLYVDTRSTAAALVDELLTDHAGGTVLFCGNRGQPAIGFIGINAEIYTRLGGTGRAPERYADMYIAVVPDEGPTRFIKTEYGGSSSLDPALLPEGS